MTLEYGAFTGWEWTPSSVSLLLEDGTEFDYRKEGSVDDPQMLVIPNTHKNITLEAAYNPRYYLQVNDAEGSGYYEVGVYAKCIADTNRHFLRWDGEGAAYISGTVNGNDSLHMPAKDISITAIYDIRVYVQYGSGTGYYQPGDEVAIKFEYDNEDYMLSEWTGDIDGLTLIDGTPFDPKNSDTQIIVVPNHNVSLSGEVKLKPLLTLTSGTPYRGYYSPGKTVTITANANSFFKEFDCWVSEDEVEIADPTAVVTEIIMPETDTHITATYKTKYALTVKYGEPNGTTAHLPGTTVTVTADLSKGEFNYWEVTGMELQDPTLSTVDIVMPANAVTMTAIYKAPRQLQLSGGTILGTGESSGWFTAGTKVTITANNPSNFTRWIPEADIEPFDVNSSTTEIIMPDGNITIRAYSG